MMSDRSQRGAIKLTHYREVAYAYGAPEYVEFADVGVVILHSSRALPVPRQRRTCQRLAQPAIRPVVRQRPDANAMSAAGDVAALPAADCSSATADDLATLTWGWSPLPRAVAAADPRGFSPGGGRPSLSAEDNGGLRIARVKNVRSTR